MISIGCPIYRSLVFADFVYRSIHKYTPQLGNGEAEFYFVANDPTIDIVQFLRKYGYRYYLQENTHFTEAELTAKGIGKPEYSNRVYRACNRVFSEARGETVVLISSDMAFSPGWLDGLMRVQDGTKIVTSQLVEPLGADEEHGSIRKELGEFPSEFREAEFLALARSISRPETRERGQYVPACIPQALFQEFGGYPEGNLIRPWRHFEQYPADVALHERYEKLGIPHVTALDSVVYHFFRGEMREVGQA